jgi:formylglycine-generating enzyme required for sulfatase activity
MHGNVWEICLDNYSGNEKNPYQETPTPTEHWYDTHPVKGGSYQRGPWRHRASFQMGWNTEPGEDYGIRVALTLD